MWLAGMLLTLMQADPLLAWMDRQAQTLLDAREAAVARVGDRAALAERQKFVRAKVLEIIGGLPAKRGPLRARVTGVIRAEGYLIEKVLFESLPGVLVSANVYRPAAAGRYPGVLAPSGHTQEGKPEPQLLAANLARKGFVVITWDPIGQGEREQTYVPMLGRALAGGGGNEHLELGARSLLLGQSVARYFIFDGMRALDYLQSRADVDATRLGVTGCSGGGAIATYLAALDERIKVATAGCFISTFRQLFTGATPDSEMSLPRFLASGLDQADLFTMRAPLPFLMMATEEDYFPPPAARPVYEETRRLYALLGAEERVRFHVGPGPHGTPREAREEIYGWLIRWLKDGRGSATEERVKLYTNLELRVTASGNVGGRRVWEAMLDEYRVLRAPRDRAALVAELRRLGVPFAGVAPTVRVDGREERKGVLVETVRFESEPGIELTGRFYRLANGTPRRAVLMVEEQRLPVPLYVQRSAATAPLAEAMARAGALVLELAPRDSPAAYEGRPFLGNWVTNERADLIGRNLAAWCAHDLLAGAAVLRARAGGLDVMAYGRGVKGVWLLMAAAVDGGLKKLWLDRTPARVATLFESPYASFAFDIMMPGFARHWDFDALREGADVYWSDPTNWMNQVIEAGAGYRYRTVGEGDGPLMEEFLR